jgi:hypothetical protein
MEHTHASPESPRRLPRPCSTPHSAPVSWLSSEPAPEPQPDEAPAAAALDPAEIAAFLKSNPDAMAEVIGQLSPEGTRGNGWTPFARKLFLQVLSQTGRIGRACAYTGLSRQSAHDLRERDPLFAAGWDAAVLIARNPLADDMLEKSLDGITETVTRNGEVVATRQRYDARLSMAVLNRLDKRCDRAEEQGSKHLALVRRWGEWLDLVGKGDDAAAQALLDGGVAETPRECQDCQVSESANPTEIGDPPGVDYCWKDDGGVWMTVFAPPPGFTGRETGEFDGLSCYERECTAEEAELLDANLAAAEAEEAAAQAEELREEERLRDAWFEKLRNRLAARSPDPVPAPVPEASAASKPPPPVDK